MLGGNRAPQPTLQSSVLGIVRHAPWNCKSKSSETRRLSPFGQRASHHCSVNPARPRKPAYLLQFESNKKSAELFGLFPPKAHTKSAGCPAARRRGTALRGGRKNFFIPPPGIFSMLTFLESTSMPQNRVQKRSKTYTKVGLIRSFLVANAVIATPNRRNADSLTRRLATAISQLPYTGAKIAEWLFHQEKATLEDAGKGTCIVKPL
jgi:hypothetical protein